MWFYPSIPTFDPLEEITDELLESHFAIFRCISQLQCFVELIIRHNNPQTENHLRDLDTAQPSVPYRLKNSRIKK